MIRAKFVVVFAASAATLQACSFPEPFQATELPPPAQSAREELQTLLSQPQYTTDRCIIKDVVLGRHLYVLGAPPASGLLPGDRLLELNGTSLVGETIEAVGKALLPLPPHGMVRASIDREGTRVDLSVPCQSSRSYYVPWIDVLTAASQGEFKRCYELAMELDRQSPLPRSPSVSAMAFKCAVAAGIERSEPNPFRDAEQYRRLIDFARWDRDALASLHGDVINYTQTLQRAGYASLATELRQQLDDAERGIARRASASAPAPRPTMGSGTGFFVSKDGKILTSAHVVEGASKISVRLSSGKVANAKVLTSSPSMDLAVLQAEASNDEYLSIAPPRSARVGESVFTYGYPATSLLGEEPKFTDGSVSALSGPGGEPTFLQMSVPVQPGNSGGPLLNDTGQVVGIVAAQAAVPHFVRMTGTLPQNINWAVKAEYVLPMVELPAPRPKTTSRQAAIERAQKAIVCKRPAEAVLTLRS